MVRTLRAVLAAALLLLAACPRDTTAPVAAITAPAPGDTVSGSVAVDCRATDNRSVRSVEFYVDDTLRGRVTTPSGDVFTWTWDTRPLTPGSHRVLRCIAYDAVGNQGLSDTVGVTVGTQAGTHHSGTVSSPETWSADGNPHFVDSDLAIDAAVTVEPGVRVFVAAGAAITVGARGTGGLAAVGTPDSFVLFTALDTVAGPWRGIDFRAGADSLACRLEYCTISHAGAGSSALVACAGPGITIRNCHLRASRSRGAWATAAFGSFRANSITGCAGLPVRVGLAGLRSVGADNSFTGNARNGVEVGGGFVTASDTWPALAVPLCFTATVTIADTANPLVVIAPGCSLLFADSCRLRVGVARPGGLRADGGYGRIVFSSLSGEPGPGRWGGIEFWEETDSLRTVLRLCTIERAGAGGAAAISLLSSPIALANCTVRDNAALGVYCFSTGPRLFEYNTVTACGGYPLRLPAQYVGRLGPGNVMTGNARDAIAVLGGAIERSTTWRDLGLPYVVSGVIDVGAVNPPTWLIEQGAELQFEPAAGLRVGLSQPGEILAVGTPDSIVFTGLSNVPGAWRGIELHPGCLNTTRIERCRVLYAGGADRGNLLIAGSEPAIVDCEIGWSSNYCVWLLESELDPDSLRARNWLHDWAPEFEDIYEGGR